MNFYTKNCGTCKYYQHKKSFCRRYPPAAISSREVRFPRTIFDEWCGEWVKRSPHSLGEALHSNLFNKWR